MTAQEYTDILSERISDCNFANEIGKISELVRTAKDFSVKFANATIEERVK